MSQFLSKKEREELFKELRLERYSKYSDRLKTILLLDEGRSIKSISEYLFLTERTLRNYKKNYLEGGIEQLIMDDYNGKECRLSEDNLLELKKHLSENLHRTTLEIKIHIESTYKVNYTIGGVRHLLKRLGFTYKKPKSVPGKANKEKQEEFVKELEKLKNSENPLYFADGVHPQHNTFCEYGWILKGEDFELKSNTGRKRVNINGAISKDSKNIFIDEAERINAQSTIRLLEKIEAFHPEAEKINVVVDNARYYKCHLVSEFLENSKINLVFLPSYSPNLNLIERLWRVLNRNIIYNKYFEKFDDFKNAILAFFDNFQDYHLEITNVINFKFQILGS